MNRGCHNCKYEERSIRDYPCSSCTFRTCTRRHANQYVQVAIASNWEPMNVWVKFVAWIEDKWSG